MKCLCASVFFAGVVTSSTMAQQGSVVGVHDPCIIKDKKTYYVFSTGGGIKVRKSSDLKNWTADGEVFGQIPQWTRQRVPRVKGLWAPDIAFFNGRFHLYYSASTFGSNHSCIGLATNRTLDRDDPRFRWEDHGLVVASQKNQNFNAIDPNVVLDERKNPWLNFGSFWSGIKMIRLDQRTGKPVPTEKLIAIAGRNGGAIEAPFIIRKNRMYYLFVSFDSCCKGVKSTYRVMVGRSRRVVGPYVDFTGKKLTDGGGTLVLSSYGSVRGPGHNAILRDGGKEHLVHHFYDGANGGKQTLQIRPLVWGSDGWPLVGEPDFSASSKPQAVSLAGKWRHSVDYGRENVITLLKGGKINRKDGKAMWQKKGTRLLLRWPRPDAGVWVDQCIVSRNGKWYVGRNQKGAIVRGIRQP